MKLTHEDKSKIHFNHKNTIINLAVIKYRVWYTVKTFELFSLF